MNATLYPGPLTREFFGFASLFRRRGERFVQPISHRAEIQIVRVCERQANKTGLDFRAAICKLCQGFRLHSLWRDRRAWQGITVAAAIVTTAVQLMHRKRLTIDVIKRETAVSDKRYNNYGVAGFFSTSGRNAS
jgi:hypothetical protein